MLDTLVKTSSAIVATAMANMVGAWLSHVMGPMNIQIDD